MQIDLISIGSGLYFLGLGLLGGFLGNILATWYNALGMSTHSDTQKRNYIHIFVVFGITITIIGLILLIIS